VRKAAVNAPQSRRFAKFGEARQSRQRLDCGGFSTAFEEGRREQKQSWFILVPIVRST
jgi:hypothetical protein